MKTTLTRVRWIVLAVLTGAALILLNGGPTAGAQSASLTGTLAILHGDPAATAGAPIPRQRPAQRYLLLEDRGERMLAIDPAVIDRAGGAQALNGKRVTVNLAAGPQTAAAAPARVQSIRAESGPSITTLNPSAPDLTGKQPFAFILCDFKDSATDLPRTKDFFDRMIANERPGLDHYWREVSFNTINLSGSQTFDWKSLPSPRSSYVANNSDGVPVAGLSKLRTDCLAQHAAVNFSLFQGIALIFNQDLDGFAYGDRETYSLDGVTRKFAFAWIGRDGISQVVLTHEMGHGLSLPHSSGPYTETYDSEWDTMSDGMECPDLFDPAQSFPFGCEGAHTIAVHKAQLGWIPASRITTVASGQSTVTLHSSTEPCGTCKQLIKIPFNNDPTTYYTVEMRVNKGYDVAVPGTGVVIHMVDESLGDRNAKVVDPDNNGDPNDGSATWSSGETYTDATRGVTVSVSAVDASAGTGSVTVTRFPEVTIGDASVVEGNSGTRNLQFTVRLSHSPAQPVRITYATSNGSAAAGSDYQARSGVLQVAAGGSTTATITVPVIGDRFQEGDENFSLKLSNPAGAVLTDATAVGRILNDDFPPPPPSCPPLTPDCQIK